MRVVPSAKEAATGKDRGIHRSSKVPGRPARDTPRSFGRLYAEVAHIFAAGHLAVFDCDVGHPFP